MIKTKKTRLTIWVMSVVLVFSLLLGLLSFQDKAKLTAKAETETDITSTISLADMGTVEAENEVRTFFIQSNGANILTSGFEQYWNDHGAANAAKNNNVDLMEKVLIDGVSMRDIINANAASATPYNGPIFPFTLGSVYSPVQLGTGADYIYLRVLIEFKSNYTLTIKSGFEVTTASGERLYTTKDVNFAVTESSVTKVVPQTDITSMISLADQGTVEAVDEIRTFFIQNNDANILTSGFEQYWNDHGATNAAKNNNVDLMEYVLIDGVSMRDIVNENAAKEGDAQYKGPIFPFTLGGVYSPVQLGTVADYIYLRVLIAYKSSYTLTIKSGFSVMTADDVRLYTTEDIEFAVTESSVSKIEEYTLSFDKEGTNALTVIGGQAIGELPELPEKEGYDSVWAIDGVEINADTVYTFGEDKTAVVLYKKDVTPTLSLDHVANQNGVHIFYMRNNGAEIGSGFEQPYWNDNGVSGANNAASNCGVDLMAYILVDGVSMRDLIDENAAKASEEQYKGEETPWSWGGLYSPVQVSTESEVMLVRVLNDFKSEYTLTIKAGFTLVTKGGEVFYTTEDMYYNVTSDACTKVYAVSFNGANTVYVSANGVVEYPVDLSETKAEDVQYSYIYNWFLNGELYDFSSPVTANIDLTSDGTFTSILKKYTVTFNGVNATEYAYGSKIEKPTVAPTKQSTAEYDYIFDAWYNGETEWDFENDTVSGNVELEAKYTATTRTYSVTFDGANATKYAYGSKIEKPADPTKKSTAEYDYAFDAWYNGKTEWDFENDTVVGNVNLVAKYTETKRSYTVTFNVTGNDVQLDPVEVEYGTDYDLSNLLEGMDLTNYVYSISVGGVEKLSVRVIADVTVDVAFTKKDNANTSDDDNSSRFGCMSTISGGMAVVSTAVMAIGFALFKKKEQ